MANDKALSAAAKVMKDPKASKNDKSAAASVLTQMNSRPAAATISDAVEKVLRSSGKVLPKDFARMILDRDVVAVARFVRARKAGDNAAKGVAAAADKILRSNMPADIKSLAASALVRAPKVAPKRGASRNAKD